MQPSALDTSQSQIELRPIPDVTLSGELSRTSPEPADTTSSLPPADRGKAAWLFLTGCFLIETLIWGFPFSYGVLQEYYLTHEPFASHSEGVTAVGTTCSGIMYMAAPVLFLLFQQYPHLRRKACIYGLFVVCTALAISSFCTTITGLILTQGLLYALGGCFLYFPIYFFIDEWFVARKGFAFGIMWAGSGMGGLLGPLVMDRLLSLYGYEIMIRAWAVGLLVISGPFLVFVKPRVPVSRGSGGRRWRYGWDFLSMRTFWILQAGNIIQGLGYFIPALYLPGYLASLDYSPVISSAMLSALNSASVPGIIALSTLSDRTHVTNIILISTLGSAVSVFLFWGLATSLPLIVVFVVTYGFFAGGYTATFAGTMKSMMELAPRSEPGSIMGLLSLGRGIGNVLCGPLSEFLLNKGSMVGGMGDKAFAYESSYGVLIVFTGVTATVGMCGWVARMLKIV